MEITFNGKPVQDLVNAILANKIKLLTYCTYPTYSAGKELHSDESADYNESNPKRGEFKVNDKNSPFVNAVDKIIFDAVKAMDTNVDNKTAVKIQVEGFEEPVYVRLFDSKRSISTDINRDKGNREFPFNGKTINEQ